MDIPPAGADAGTQGARPPAGARALISDVAACLRFYSRLPVPPLPWERDAHAMPDFRTMPRALPLAAAVIGACGAAAGTAALWLGLGPFVAATFAVATLVTITGVFHEDGLADTADGFWGGMTRTRRLEIMKDSRIGSYGTAALLLAVLLRVGLLTGLAERAGAPALAAALVAGACVSRLAGLVPLSLLPAARTDGASAAVGSPSPVTLAIALALTTGIALACAGLGGLPRAGAAAGMVGAAAVALGVTQISRRKIAGQTGDVAGAAQQMGEIAFYTGLLAAISATGP